MKIAIVVHGPNIIDSGYASKIIELISKNNTIDAKLGGTMGRTAVIDASLENVIDISEKLLPSESLKILSFKCPDAIFLINYGKSSTTGHVFGYKVYNNYLKKTKNTQIPFIQIERPGESDGSLIFHNVDMAILNNELNELINKLVSFFKLIIITNKQIQDKHFNNENLTNQERTIHGVSPNENILINGVVIGKSTSDELTLISKNDFLTEIKGGFLKDHGVEKLGKFNLNTAIVKTGLLRKSNIKPRTLTNNKNKSTFKIAYLDHAAENIYNFNDADLVVTVGDDTTLLASDILFRFNIPVIGITDGDLDKLVEKGFKTDDSVIFKLESGVDDIVGLKIFEKLFYGKLFLDFSIDNIDFENFKKDKINEFKSKIIEIINNSSYKYTIE
ncbi:DUF2117 domain-containing protein [Methanobrevibacter sp. DSM 116169]|uniref:DUF2117 domain-containing protein n=1 Tax=Methanobrevibacter sp. DSM 116169 TaxID=3242727 RepID=UPI0038FC0068